MNVAKENNISWHYNTLGMQTNSIYIFAIVQKNLRTYLRNI